MNRILNILAEIHAQPQWVRLVLFTLSSVFTVALIVTFAYPSMEREAYLAMDRSETETQQFLASQRSRTLPLVATITKGVDFLSANIGSVLGLDDNKGVDKTSEKGENTEGVYLLPLSE